MKALRKFHNPNLIKKTVKLQFMAHKGERKDKKESAEVHLGVQHRKQ